MLTVSEAAKVFNVSRQTILDWISKGIINAVQPNRLYLIPESEIERIKAGEKNGKKTYI